MEKTAKIITVFTHKGGVGKTTFVHNLAYELAQNDKRILLIDTDPQANLTSVFFGQSTNIDYSNSIKNTWIDFFKTYRTFDEQVVNFINKTAGKDIYTKDNIDLLASHPTNLANFENEWFEIVLGSKLTTNRITDNKPLLFFQSIQILKENYDFILIDTPPTSTSIITGMCLSLSDYFISPVVPNFFSFQSIANLVNVVKNWNSLLSKYEGDGYVNDGVELKSKFLGLIVNRSKKRSAKHGMLKASNFSEQTQGWTDDINNNLKSFLDWALAPNTNKRAITQEEFSSIFSDAHPYVIANIPQFPDKIAGMCEAEAVPMVNANKVASINKNITANKTNSDAHLLIQNTYKCIATQLLRIDNDKNTTIP